VSRDTIAYAIVLLGAFIGAIAIGDYFGLIGDNTRICGRGGCGSVAGGIIFLLWMLILVALLTVLVVGSKLLSRITSRSGKPRYPWGCKERAKELLRTSGMTDDQINEYLSGFAD
jgi:hypothetical protein